MKKPKLKYRPSDSFSFLKSGQAQGKPLVIGLHNIQSIVRHLKSQTPHIPPQILVVHIPKKLKQWIRKKTKKSKKQV